MTSENEPQTIVQKFEVVDSTSPRKKKKKLKRLCLGLFITISVLLILLFVGVPVIFFYCTSFQRLIVFPNWYENPKIHDFGDPTVMLPGTRNFKINVGENEELGVWHILSKESMKNLSSNRTDNSYFDRNLKNSGEHIYLYLHGNSNTRAAQHRKKLYEVLRKYGHVIAFDYRGYADSTNRPPTEEQMSEDALAVYNWLRQEIHNPGSIIVWGHSLGSAVAINLCTQIDTEHISALVLEAPFTNMTAEVRSHPMSKLFSWLPYFEKLIMEPFKFEESSFAFKSDEKINSCKISKLAILHAKNDNIIPFKMGQTMCSLAEKYNAGREVQLISFHKGGHQDIWRQPDFETKFSYIANDMRGSYTGFTSNVVPWTPLHLPTGVPVSQAMCSHRVKDLKKNDLSDSIAVKPINGAEYYQKYLDSITNIWQTLTKLEVTVVGTEMNGGVIK